MRFESCMRCDDDGSMDVLGQRQERAHRSGAAKTALASVDALTRTENQPGDTLEFAPIGRLDPGGLPPSLNAEGIRRWTYGNRQPISIRAAVGKRGRRFWPLKVRSSLDPPPASLGSTRRASEVASVYWPPGKDGARRCASPLPPSPVCATAVLPSAPSEKHPRHGCAGRTFTLKDVQETDTVISLKRQIENLEDVPAEAQALTIGGRSIGFSTVPFFSFSQPEHDDRPLSYCAWQTTLCCWFQAECCRKPLWQMASETTRPSICRSTHMSCRACRVPRNASRRRQEAQVRHRRIWARTCHQSPPESRRSWYHHVLGLWTAIPLNQGPQLKGNHLNS